MAREIAELYGESNLSELRTYIWKELVMRGVDFPKPSTQHANQIWHHLRTLESKGYVYRNANGFMLLPLNDDRITI